MPRSPSEWDVVRFLIVHRGRAVALPLAALAAAPTASLAPPPTEPIEMVEAEPLPDLPPATGEGRTP